LSADTKSTVQTHTFRAMQVDKNRTFYNSIEAGWITGLQTLSYQNVLQSCTTFYITNK